MREGNASMYLGSPRMAEMVIGEKVTLEEMGGARMHTSVSGCGHFLVASDEEGIDLAKRYLSYFPSSWKELPPPAPPAAGRRLAADRGDRARGPEPPLRHAGAARRARRRGLVARGPARLGGRADRRLRPPRRTRRRHRRQPAEGEGRGAVRGLGRQGRPLHLDLQRVQRAASLPRRRARLHDRQEGRARGHHPRRRQDDLGRLRGDRAEDLGGRAQVLRGRSVRDGGPGLRARLLPRAADALRSR